MYDYQQETVGAAKGVSSVQDRSGTACLVLAASTVVLLMSWVAPVWAQEQAPGVIRVAIEGNRVTRQHIIAREISHPLGQPFDSTQARSDRNRLYNLGIFEEVEVFPRRDSSGRTELVVRVVETVRFVPYPRFYYLDGLGWSYGGGMLINNFRGLNQRLNIGGTIGEEYTYSLVFSDPWFMGDRIFINSWVSQTYRRHPVERFRYGLSDLELGGGKYFRRKTVRLSGALSVERRSVAWEADAPPESVNLRHQLFQAKLGLWWRTTDIWRDPTRGTHINLNVTAVWPLDEVSPKYTWHYWAGSLFLPLWEGIRPLVGGLGLRVSHFSGGIPLYLKQYLGGQWVRGYYISPTGNPEAVSDRHETTNIAVASMELRYTLIPRKLRLGRQVGISGVAFLDAGWGYGPANSLATSLPMVGYGLGLRVFLPLVDALALDWGANPYDEKIRFRLSIGQAF